MSRPSDHLQPSGKRRPGEQLTKDNAGDSDEEGPAVDPGTWGKADATTMSRRKVVRARRGAAAAEPTPQAQAAGTDQAAGSNPFAGVSLAPTTAAADNPFAGVSLLPTKATEAAADKSQETEGKDSAAPAAATAAGAVSTEDAEAPAEVDASQQPTSDKVEAAGGTASKAPTAASVPAAEAAPASTTAPGVTAASPNADGTEQKDAAAPSVGTGVFGGAGGGFGGFSGFGTSGGFGATGGFGGFAAAAKDGAAGGSLFGSYTAPKPGSLFAPVAGFGAAKQSDAGGEEEAAGGEEVDAEGNEVFGGDSTQPVVQLSEVPKQTGEEDEETVYAADGALFEFVNGKEWRERGKGELRLNVNNGTKQARMVMRQRGSQRLLLNARLHPTMATSKMMGGKGVTFAAVNAAAASAAAGDAAAGQEGRDKASQEEGGSQPEAGRENNTQHVVRTYALKVKSAEKINEFVAAVDKHKVRPTETAAPAAAPAEEQV